MGLDDGLGDAHQRCAADLVDVHGSLHGGKVVFQHGRGQLVFCAGVENALERLHHVFDHALGALEENVAGKAVADDHIHVAREDAGAFDVADEAQAALLARLPEQSEGLMLQLAALGILGADIEKADAGIVAAHELSRVEAAHEGKLQQVLGGALHVRAAVDEHDAVLARGQYRGHGRAADAADALDRERCPGEERAGRARGDDRVAFAVFQAIERHGHGGILFAAGRGAGVVLHGDDLAGVHHGDIRAALGGKAGLDLLPASHQLDLHAELASCTDGTFDDLLRGVVAAHGVNDDLHMRKPPCSSNSL